MPTIDVPQTHLAGACFKVTGEHLTAKARDLVLSERWDDALALLLDSLAGEGVMDVAVDVLRGTKQLTGINELTLVDDPDSEGYREELSDLMAGRTRLSGGWYRPYAAISHIPIRIFARTPSSMVGLVWRLTQGGAIGRFSAQQIREEIAATLSDHPGDVLTCIHGLQFARDAVGSHFNGIKESIPKDAGAFIFWTKCDAPPFWVRRTQVYSTQEAAVRDYVAAFGKLEDRCDWFPAEEPLASDESDPKEAAATVNIERIKEQQEAEDAREAARFAEWAREIDNLVPLVRAQADLQGGWLTISVPDGREVRVPRAPFEHWAFRRTHGAHLAHPWSLIAPPSMKQDLDDQHHTDWMLGAGLLTSEPGRPITWAEWRMKDEVLHDAVEAFAFNLQTERLGFKAHVLCGLGAGVGKVVHPTPNQIDIPLDSVIVIPNAGSEYYAAARMAVAVITEQGGTMAHLATVGREEGFILVRVPDARQLYPEGTRVLVDGVDGHIQIVS